MVQGLRTHLLMQRAQEDPRAAHAVEPRARAPQLEKAQARQRKPSAAKDFLFKSSQFGREEGEEEAAAGAGA